MICDLGQSVYFDNTNLYIIHGEDHLQQYEEEIEQYPEIRHRTHEKRYPTLIFLSATACNLHCKYCYAEAGTYGNVSEEKQFSFEKYRYCYETARKIFGGVKAISFFGGEPLLNYPEIRRFVEYLHNTYAKDEIPEMAVSSNGTIMNGDIKAFLKKYQIAFSTSLDGTKFYNDYNRIGDGVESVYDAVVKTLQELEDTGIEKGLQLTFSKIHLQHYRKDDAKKWLEEIEKLGISNYAMVAATTDHPDCHIDLKDPEICRNYVQMCNDMADYYLEQILQGEKIYSYIFPGMLLRIIKREYQEDCNAGFSIALSPDLRVYPCHVCADKAENGFEFDEDFLKKKKEHTFFSGIEHLGRENTDACRKCVAYAICPSFCKGMVSENEYQEVDERCLMYQIFAGRAVLFLANEYKNHKEEIKASLKAVSENARKK